MATTKPRVYSLTRKILSPTDERFPEAENLIALARSSMKKGISSNTKCINSTAKVIGKEDVFYVTTRL